jgi:hypothetical protein
MNRVKQVIFGLAILIVVAGVLVVAYFVFLGNSSVSGTVAPKKAASERPETHKNLTLKANYFNLEYPDTYLTQTTQVRDKQALEQFLLTANTFYDKQMAITIRQLPSTDISDDGSYKLRISKPDKYKQQAMQSAAGPAQVFVNQESDEQTIFIQKGKLLATIALTSDGADDDLSNEVKGLLAGFRWTQ